MDETIKLEIQQLIDTGAFDSARQRLQKLAMTDEEALAMLERLNRVVPPAGGVTPQNMMQPVPVTHQQGVAPIDPNVAWLELIGLIGFLGIGYLVAGRTNDGILRLIGFMAFLFVGWLITAILIAVIIGICLVPVMLVAQVAIPVWSALQLKAELDRQAGR
jgi:hypothetical protein